MQRRRLARASATRRAWAFASRARMDMSKVLLSDGLKSVLGLRDSGRDVNRLGMGSILLMRWLVVKLMDELLWR